MTTTQPKILYRPTCPTCYWHGRGSKSEAGATERARAHAVETGHAEAKVQQYTPFEYKSRSQRFNEALNGLSADRSAWENALEELQTWRAEGAKEPLDIELPGESSFDEIESLKDEIDEWASNLESNNMEHLPKYEEVCEARDTLEEVMNGLENIRWPDTDHVETTDEAESLESEIEEVISGLEEAEGSDVPFPGMY